MAAAKTVLISGANAGIGFAVVQALCRSGNPYRIILCGRSLEKAQAAATAASAEIPAGIDTHVIAIQLDLSDDESITAAANKVAADFGHIDTLVNNAGASFDVPIQNGSMSARAGWAATWDTNVTGTHLVTTAMAPVLLKSAKPRLIFITSGTSSLAETLEYDTANLKTPVNAAPPAGWPKPQSRTIISYRTSKAGLNMLMREWARILRNDGVKVFALAPGFLATNFGGEDLKKLGALDPSVGGESVRMVIEGGRDNDAGLVIRNYGDPNVQPW